MYGNGLIIIAMIINYIKFSCYVCSYSQTVDFNSYITTNQEDYNNNNGMGYFE